MCPETETETEAGICPFLDIEGAPLVPDGPARRQKPTLLPLHAGGGWDHSGCKPRSSKQADLAQVVCLDHRGQDRSEKWSREGWALDHRVHAVVCSCRALGIQKPPDQIASWV